MTTANHLDWSKFEEAASHADFGSNAWLTFYLTAAPELLDALNADLEKIGSTNLTGSEGGFVYAKVPVEMAQIAVEEGVAKVRSLAAFHGVEIILIDLDSSPELHSMKFVTLWKGS